MAETELPRTQAAIRHSRWPGWIWSVPIAAVGVLTWLGVRFFFTHGADVTVLFDKAEGVNAQATRVNFRGVDIGGVSSVRLSDNGRQVIVQLALERSMEKFLRAGTRFWLQGVTLEDPTTLGAVLSGPTVEMEPGPGAPQRVFVGLSEAPAFTEPVQGTRFSLLAEQHGSVQQGSGVYYLGLEVGKVLGVEMVSPHQFRLEVLVRAPYDQLVHVGSRFWDAGAFELSMTSGLKVQLLSTSALLKGAVAFETSAQAAALPRARAEQEFPLYQSEESAQLAPSGPTARYRVSFSGAVGELKVGAPVKLRDFTVGQVREVNFELDAQTGALRTPVTIELDAERLHLSATAGGNDATAKLNGAVAQLVRAGLRARMSQSPELVGSYYVALDFVPHVAPASLDTASTPPELPSASGGGLSQFTTELGQLPLQQIGSNMRDITAHVRTLVASPQLQDSLHHLDDTLSQVDSMVKGVSPEVKPLIAKLRQAAEQLQGIAAAAHQTLGGADEQGGLDEAVQEMTRTARSVRVLADYLERHPEALIQGKR